MSDFFKDVRNLSKADIKHFIESEFDGDANFQSADGATMLHWAALYSGNAEVIKVLISMGGNVNAEISGITPLHGAKDAYIAQALISGGANINALSNDNSTPLHSAVNNNNVDVIKILVDNGADVNILDNNNISPFDIAITYGRVEIVELFLSHGANIVPINSNLQLFPLQLAAGSINTAGENNIQIAKLLVSSGAKINDIAYTVTPLDIAIKSSDLKMMFFLLDSEPLDKIKQYLKNILNENINLQDGNGWTALHHAVYGQYPNVVKALITLNINTNIREENGFTPFEISVGFGYAEIVEIFLPYIPDINVRSKNDYTFLHMAAISKKKAGDKNIEVAKILVSHGADVDAQTNGKTPCDMAKEKGDTAMVKYLSSVVIERGKAEIEKIKLKYSDKLLNNPDDVKILEDRAFEFRMNGFYYEAIEDYTKIIKLEPDNVKAFLDRGMVYSQIAELIRQGGTACSQIKEYDDAIKNYNEVLNLSPENASAYQYRGMAYSQKGEYNKAISDFNDSIRIKPNECLSYMGRGIAYHELCMYKQSISDFEKLIDLNPDKNTISIAKYWLNEANKKENERIQNEQRLEQEKKNIAEQEKRKIEEQEKKRIKYEKSKKVKKVFLIVLVILAALLIGFIIYNNQENSISIPNNKTIIKDNEYSRKQLINVVIPETITSIGNNAFRRNKLTTIFIPDSVTIIGDKAFEINKLTEITIGSNVTLGIEAFGSGFETIYKNNKMGGGTYKRNDDKSNIWNIWYEYFNYKNNNGNIIIIGYNGIGGELIIPTEINGNPVTYIGEQAFMNKNITNIVIGNLVLDISNSSFQYNNLSSVRVPNSVISLGVNSFADNPITSFSIGANVTLGFDNSGSSGVLGQNTGFNSAYNNAGKRAGNYIRSNVTSTTWTRRNY